MRVAVTDQSRNLFLTVLFIFTMTLVLSIRSDPLVLSKQATVPTHSEGDFHPPADTSDLFEFILHKLAYFISCFSVTVFLLFCAAIILGLPTVLIEILAEAYNSARQIGLEERYRQERARQHTTDAFTEPLNDLYCNTWNRR